MKKNETTPPEVPQNTGEDTEKDLQRSSSPLLESLSSLTSMRFWEEIAERFSRSALMAILALVAIGSLSILFVAWFQGPSSDTAEDTAVLAYRSVIQLQDRLKEMEENADAVDLPANPSAPFDEQSPNMLSTMGKKIESRLNTINENYDAPSSQLLLYYAGLIEFKRNNLDKAEDYFQKAASVNFSVLLLDMKSLIFSGMLLLEKESYSDAIMVLKNAAERTENPLKNHARYFLALAYLKNKDYTNAAQTLDKIYQEKITTQDVENPSFYDLIEKTKRRIALEFSVHSTAASDKPIANLGISNDTSSDMTGSNDAVNNLP